MGIVVMRKNMGEKPSVAHFTRDHVCGPAVQLAFWANVFAWGLYVALAPLGLSFYSCSGENLAKFTQTGLALFALILVVSLSLSRCSWSTRWLGTTCLRTWRSVDHRRSVVFDTSSES